jgi:hypothetical protein
VTAHSFAFLKDLDHAVQGNTSTSSSTPGRWSPPTLPAPGRPRRRTPTPSTSPAGNCPTAAGRPSTGGRRRLTVPSRPRPSVPVRCSSTCPSG